MFFFFLVLNIFGKLITQDYSVDTNKISLEQNGAYDVFGFFCVKIITQVSVG